MRIWYQSAVEMNDAGVYADALQTHFARVASGLDVRLVGVDAATWRGYQPSQMFRYPAVFTAALYRCLMRNALQAEAEGFDAFLVGTYIEPFLRELRSAVGIPVVSSLEACLLVACSVGRTVGLVTLNAQLARILRTRIGEHRLGKRVGPVLSMEPALHESDLTALFDYPGEYLDSFYGIVRKAIAADADVIVPAEGILAEITASNNIGDIDDAVVLDGIGVPLAYAQMLVGLRHTTGLRTARGWYYDRPDPEIVKGFVAGLG